ncbi:MAG: hypothetical protein CSA38_02785 [Flavobacteriales bacterium]|nr:MAG: hypothetical protein CSA38_02785 [Flavobacteriales bacterium]
MKKTIISSLFLAALTLMSCGRDSDTPNTPDTPDTPNPPETPKNPEKHSASGNVSVSFKFNQDYQDLKYSVYVVENDIVLPENPQKNYTNLYGGAAKLPDFKHNHTLKVAAGNTPATGASLGNVTASSTMDKNVSVNFEVHSENVDKTEVIVFVTDATGKVVNAQIAHANETKDYEMVGTNYKHKYILEDVTGIWCGYCPRWAYLIDLAKEQSWASSLIPVGVHYGDILQVPSGKKIEKHFENNYGLEGFPFALFNRDHSGDNFFEGAETWQNVMDNIGIAVGAEPTSPIGIKISSNFTVAQ